MGKLVKPQRTRKHKKIKAIDPFYVGPRTSDRKAAFANQPPKKNDEDVVTFRAREFMRLKEEAKNIQKKKHKKRQKKNFQENPANTKIVKGMTRPVKPVPTFKQHKGETDKEFMRRVHKETEAVINMTKFEAKFDVDLHETETGEYRHMKRSAEEPTERGTKKKKKKLKMKEKAKERKEAKMQEKFENFDHLKDEVIFGEVAVAPPTITAKPRKAKERKTNQPGAKQLLLKSMLQPNPEKPKSAAERSAGQSLKRKYLSIAERRILDAEREKAIAMYRLLKKRKKFEQKPVP